MSDVIYTHQWKIKRQHIATFLFQNARWEVKLLAEIDQLYLQLNDIEEILKDLLDDKASTNSQQVAVEHLANLLMDKIYYAKLELERVQYLTYTPHSWET
jgi:hypothetical protein